MAHEQHPLRVDITHLIGRPGATEDVAMTLARHEIATPVGEWGPADEALTSPLTMSLVVEMLLDGLVVRGQIDFETTLPCARCLADVVAEHARSVSEMYIDPDRLKAEDEEIDLGYELHVAEGFVDLEALVRDVIVDVLPVRVLCRPECAGLCPTCGIDLNTDECDHRGEDQVDPRWAALEKLDLPPG